MSRTAFWIGACVALGCAPGTRTRPGEAVAAAAEPIVGGAPATAADIAGTVAIADANGPFCTGTLVAPTVVVTAAHCVASDTGQPLMAASALSVIAGALDANAPPAADVLAVASLAFPPSYPLGTSIDADGLGQDDDIALLVLAAPTERVAVIPVLPMADLDNDVTPGTPLTIAGYGIIGPNEATDPSGVLYRAETPFVRRSDHELFAGDGSNPDTCPGDSGGPAYLETATGPWLVAATSRSGAQAVALCGEGGIYTLVGAYEAWLQQASNGAYPPAVTPAPPSATAAPSEESACSVGRVNGGASATRDGAGLAALALALGAFGARARAHAGARARRKERPHG